MRALKTPAEIAAALERWLHVLYRVQTDMLAEWLNILIKRMNPELD